MNDVRQGWLVARRELRERSRSAAFVASLVFMALAVAAAIVLPALLSGGGGTRVVGLAGQGPSELASTIEAHGRATGTSVRIHSYDSVAAGEEAVRDAAVDVLVVNGRQLDWRRQPDAQLRAVLAGAIQTVAIRERALSAGMNPDDLVAMVAPVVVKDVELGQVTGRTPGDETAAYALSLILFFTLSFYGGQVLTGVIEEKSSRVVEVLLARMPARNLLAGKIVGIGLLGLAQVAVVALVALVAVAFTDGVDLPAARPNMIVWALLWFVLGYALYATAFGTMGSLASRSEDASSVTGPLTVTLVVSFFLSYATIGSPYTAWARAVSWFPPTAPFAMPNRMAMGAATWWDPVVAALRTAAAIVGLVVFGGRVYGHAILHTGGVLKLGQAWGDASEGMAKAGDLAAATTASSTPRHEVAHGAMGSALIRAIPALAAMAVGAVVFSLSRDVIMGVAAVAIVFAIASKIMKGRQHAHR